MPRRGRAERDRGESVIFAVQKIEVVEPVKCRPKPLIARFNLLAEHSKLVCKADGAIQTSVGLEPRSLQFL